LVETISRLWAVWCVVCGVAGLWVAAAVGFVAGLGIWNYFVIERPRRRLIAHMEKQASSETRGDL
jgi:hypothetical protein